jgi:hypothetical protein
MVGLETMFFDRDHVCRCQYRDPNLVSNVGQAHYTDIMPTRTTPTVQRSYGSPRSETTGKESLPNDIGNTNIIIVIPNRSRTESQSSDRHRGQSNHHARRIEGCTQVCLMSTAACWLSSRLAAARPKHRPASKC